MQPDAAVEAANRCIELKPQWSKGFFRRGEAYCGLLQFPKAIQVRGIPRV